MAKPSRPTGATLPQTLPRGLGRVLVLNRGDRQIRSLYLRGPLLNLGHVGRAGPRWAWMAERRSCAGPIPRPCGRSGRVVLESVIASRRTAAWRWAVLNRRAFFPRRAAFRRWCQRTALDAAGPPPAFDRPRWATDEKRHATQRGRVVFRTP